MRAGATMSEGPIVAARRKVAYEVARAIVDELECETELDTRELKRWENKIEARLLSRSEYLAPLLDAYEQQLATVTRERDEARAKIAAYVKAHDERVTHSKTPFAGESWFAERDALSNDVADALDALRAEVPRG